MGWQKVEQSKFCGLIDPVVIGKDGSMVRIGGWVLTFEKTVGLLCSVQYKTKINHYVLQKQKD
jgi:hypothetical protein